MARRARVPLSGLEEGPRRLEAKDAHYLREVLRLRGGDAFLAFDAQAQLEADATLLDADHREARCEIGPVRAALRASNTGIVLVQALGKGDKTEHVVRSATALGVSAVHLVESARSVARAGERAHAKQIRLHDIALDAARQCGRGDVPKIEGPHALEHELSTWREVSALKLCLDPSAAESVRSLTRDWTAGAPLALLIGPEGGLAESELEAAESAGFVRAGFGELVLRTEIAGIAVLGALLLLRQR